MILSKQLLPTEHDSLVKEYFIHIKLAKLVQNFKWNCYEECDAKQCWQHSNAALTSICAWPDIIKNNFLNSQYGGFVYVLTRSYTREFLIKGQPQILKLDVLFLFVSALGLLLCLHDLVFIEY